MRNEKDFGIATLILLNILLFTMSSFEKQLFFFLFQSVFISFYCFTCMSYFYTILRKKSSSTLPIIIILVMALNLFLIPPRGYPIYVISGSIAITIVTLSIRIYKKRKVIRKQDEIDKELNDNWEEEPHILFEESEIGKLV